MRERHELLEPDSQEGEADTQSEECSKNRPEVSGVHENLNMMNGDTRNSTEKSESVVSICLAILVHYTPVLGAEEENVVQNHSSKKGVQVICNNQSNEFLFAQLESSVHVQIRHVEI